MPRGNLDIDLMAFINPCPLMPSTLTVSCSNPASATMPDSIFLPAVMKMILDPGYLDKTSLPPATPGNRCPPVPPPAIITLRLSLFFSFILSTGPIGIDLIPCDLRSGICDVRCVIYHLTSPISYLTSHIPCALYFTPASLPRYSAIYLYSAD